ncbi:MAG: LysR family transcriptional regulator [Chloroflexi bacterium]|nr:LysR family transcriptional regulator [Chloroflexota bacterium]
MKVHELQVFLIAAEEENFSAAGRKLHLSQPAISLRIRGLEQQLKQQLFQRNGKRIALTEAGRELVPLACEMINLSTRIEDAMCASQGAVKGHMVIGCSTSAGEYVLPQLVGAFREIYPEVDFSVEWMDRQTVERTLVEKKIHIGVLSPCSKNNELECWTLLTDKLVLIVGANHPWAARERVALAELRTAVWILREGGAATRQLVAAILGEHGCPEDDLRVAMELGSVEAVEAAVEAGHGVSFISRITARRGLDLGRIRIVDVEGLSVQREIYLARNRMRVCTCAELKFREFVESLKGQQLIASILR